MLPPSELCTRTWCGSAQLKWRSQQPSGRASVAASAHVYTAVQSTVSCTVIRKLEVRVVSVQGRGRAGQVRCVSVRVFVVYRAGCHAFFMRAMKVLAQLKRR